MSLIKWLPPPKATNTNQRTYCDDLLPLEEPKFCDGSLPSMKLCDICQKMNATVLLEATKTRQQLPDGDWNYGEGFLFGYYTHQPSVSALLAAASSGCDLCSLFLEGCMEGKQTSGWNSADKSVDELLRLCERFSLKLKTEIPCLIKIKDSNYLESFKFISPERYMGNNNDKSKG